MNRMHDEVERWKEAAERAKQELAEVVDECVFSENQRKAAEDALRAAASQYTVDRELLLGMDLLLLYVSTLEHHILLPAASSISSVVASTVAETKNDAAKRLDVINCLVAAETPYAVRRALSLSEPPPTVASQAIMKRNEILSAASPLSLEDNYVLLFTMMSSTHQCRSLVQEFLTKLGSYNTTAGGQHAKDPALTSMRQAKELLEDVIAMSADGTAIMKLVARVHELEDIVRENDEERQQVAQRFQVLQRAIEAAKSAEKERHSEAINLDELTMLRMQVQQQSETIRAQQEELLSQGRELRECKRDHEDHIAKLKKQLSDTVQLQSSSAVDGFIRRVDGSGDRSSSQSERESASATHSFQTKIRAFEMTISALNAELAALEDKMVAVERKADDEAAESSRQISQLKKRHKEELDECDAVVERMTSELEELIRENMSLRQRLKR